MKPFNERLLDLRQSAGYSQEDLTDKIDFNRANYISVEKGRRPAPDNLLKKLAPLYGLDAKMLIEERDAWEIIKKYPQATIKLALNASSDVLERAFEVVEAKDPRKLESWKQREKEDGG